MAFQNDARHHRHHHHHHHHHEDQPSPTETSSLKKKKLRFGLVHERRYLIGLSENPAVSSGVSVGLSWECVSERTVPVCEYRRSPRAPRWLPPVLRREMLYRAGYTFKQVEAMRDLIVATQRDRIKSLPPLCLLEQAPWFACRGVRRSFLRTFYARRDPCESPAENSDKKECDEPIVVSLPNSILRTTSHHDLIVKQTQQKRRYQHKHHHQLDHDDYYKDHNDRQNHHHPRTRRLETLATRSNNQQKVQQQQHFKVLHHHHHHQQVPCA